MEPFPDDIFNLADIVLRVSREDPERIAVIEPDGWEGYGTRRYKRHTYAELSADAESVAVGLREMGIAEMTRIVFMSPPSYEACVMGVALTRVGAFSIWIDPSVGYRNIAERLRRVKPEAFLGIALAHIGRITFGWGPRALRKLVLTGMPTLAGSPHCHRVSALPRRAIDQVAAKTSARRAGAAKSRAGRSLHRSLHHRQHRAGETLALPASQLLSGVPQRAP